MINEPKDIEGLVSKQSEKKIELDYPITIEREEVDDLVYTELILQRVKTKQLKKLPRSCFVEEPTMIELIPLIAAICRVDEEVIDELDIADLTKVGESIQSFLEQSPQTGKK